MLFRRMKYGKDWCKRPSTWKSMRCFYPVISSIGKTGFSKPSDRCKADLPDCVKPEFRFTWSPETTISTCCRMYFPQNRRKEFICSGQKEPGRSKISQKTVTIFSSLDGRTQHNTFLRTHWSVFRLIG